MGEYLKVLIIEIFYENSLLETPMNFKDIEEQVHRISVFLEPIKEVINDRLYYLFEALYKQVVLNRQQKVYLTHVDELLNNLVNELSVKV